MRAEVRATVRRRFDFRCGYCGVSEVDSGALLTIDHYRPASQGGGDDIENLVYCCHACNEFKSDYWQPETAARRILHPILDDLTLHFEVLPDGALRPRTETGAFHVQRLRLNRPALIAHRRRRQEIEHGDRERAEFLQRITEMENRVQSLLGQLDQLRGEAR